MNQKYRDALSILQKLESELATREDQFNQAYKSLNRTKDYIQDHSHFKKLDFSEAKDYLARAEIALDDRKYLDSKNLSEKAKTIAEDVIGKGNPNVVIEVEKDLSGYFNAGEQKQRNIQKN